MNIDIVEIPREELVSIRAELLQRAGTTFEDLIERRDLGHLADNEWDLLEHLEGVEFLLGG